MADYENASICAKCAGLCCKAYPGSTHPADFDKVTYSSLVELLRSGLWAIDWWEGDARENGGRLPRTEYIRPAIKGEEDRIFHGAWGGECVFLTGSGCKLALADRPTTCRTMEPTEERSCIDHSPGEGRNAKQRAALAWLPYRRILLRAGHKVMAER